MQGLLERLDAGDLQDGSEDLFLIGPHVGLHLVEQAGPDEEALLIALQ